MSERSGIREPFDWGFVACAGSALQAAAFLTLGIISRLTWWQWAIGVAIVLVLAFFIVGDAEGNDLDPWFCVSPTFFYGWERLMVNIHAYAIEFATVIGFAGGFVLMLVYGSQALHRHRSKNMADA